MRGKITQMPFLSKHEPKLYPLVLICLPRNYSTVLTHRPGTHPGLDPSLQTLLENVMALESTEQISSWLCTERAWVNQSHGRALTCKSVQTHHCPCLLLPLPLAQNRVAWSYKGSAMCCMDLDLPQAEVEQRMASGIQDSKTQAAFPHS